MWSALIELVVALLAAWIVWRIIAQRFPSDSAPRPSKRREPGDFAGRPARLRTKPGKGAGAVALAEPDEDDEQEPPPPRRALR